MTETLNTSDMTIDEAKTLCIMDLVALNLGCTRGKESDEVDDGEDWIPIWYAPDGKSWSYTPLTFSGKIPV